MLAKVLITLTMMLLGVKNGAVVADPAGIKCSEHITKLAVRLSVKAYDSAKLIDVCGITSITNVVN